ncbi:MAG: glycosyltransferase [archaeon]|nr:glycosyltransferase [archaeon]
MENVSVVTLVYYKNYEALEKKCSIIINEMSGKDEIIFVLNRENSEKAMAIAMENKKLLNKYNIDEELTLIAKKYGALLVIPSKNGLATARNEGIENAKNEIIIISDEDTIPEKDYIKNIKNCFDKTNSDFIFGRDLKINKNTGYFAWWRNEYEMAFSKRNQIYNLKQITLENFANCAGRNIAFKKSEFNKIGKYDDKFDNFIGEDSDLQLRFVKNNRKVCFCPEMKTKHLHRMTFVNLLKKFWINGKSSANWLFYVQSKNSSEKKIKNYVPFSELIFFIILLSTLFLSNIFYPMAVFIFYGVYKFFKKLRSKTINIKFFALSLCLLPIESIVSLVAFIFEFSRRKLISNK